MYVHFEGIPINNSALFELVSYHIYHISWPLWKWGVVGFWGGLPECVSVVFYPADEHKEWTFMNSGLLKASNDLLGLLGWRFQGVSKQNRITFLDGSLRYKNGGMCVENPPPFLCQSDWCILRLFLGLTFGMQIPWWLGSGHHYWCHPILHLCGGDGFCVTGCYSGCLWRWHRNRVRCAWSSRRYECIQEGLHGGPLCSGSFLNH